MVRPGYTKVLSLEIWYPPILSSINGTTSKQSGLGASALVWTGCPRRYLCGRSYLGQELVVLFLLTELVDNLWSSPGEYPLHSSYMTCRVTGSLDTVVSTDIKRCHTTGKIYCRQIKTDKIIWHDKSINRI